MPKYKVPKDIQLIAKRAIDQNLSLPKSQRASMKEENGKIVFGTGMRTARRLSSGEIDIQQAILMRAWFSRHGASPKEKEARKDKTSKASISWRLWGGNAGQRFVNRLVKEYERQQKKDS
jgi:hypothetical protein